MRHEMSRNQDRSVFTLSFILCPFVTVCSIIAAKDEQE